MFSVTPVNPFGHDPEDETWHFSLTSIRGLSRLFMMWFVKSYTNLKGYAAIGNTEYRLQSGVHQS